MTPRKRKTEYSIAGRPPKDPQRKVGTPVRCLVTEGVALALVESAQRHGIPEPNVGLVPSDELRLFIFRGLVAEGLMTPDLAEDPTWDGLKAKGLV